MFTESIEIFFPFFCLFGLVFKCNCMVLEMFWRDDFCNELHLSLKHTCHIIYTGEIETLFPCHSLQYY